MIVNPGVDGYTKTPN